MAALLIVALPLTASGEEVGSLERRGRRYMGMISFFDGNKFICAVKSLLDPGSLAFVFWEAVLLLLGPNDGNFVAVLLLLMDSQRDWGVFL